MQLTRVERWVLSNQYRILELLEPGEATGYAHWREALECGYEGEYERIAACVYPQEDVMSASACSEVLDILEMFRILKFSFSKLEDGAGIDESKLKFTGFSGNDETGYMPYTRYFCGPAAHRRRYEELDRGDDFDSHLPMLPTYRRMLATYQPIHSGKMARHAEPWLTREEIIEVLAARCQPTRV